MRAWTLAIVFAVSLGATAAPWLVETVPCCFVVHPPGYAGKLPAGVQEIYDAVADLWLPAPEEGEAATVVLYDDFEEFWTEADYFGIAGVYYPPPLPEGLFRGPERALSRYGLQDPAGGLVAGCCLPESWEVTLAHELVHLWQYRFHVGIPDLGLDPILIQEGMARWTEHRLGYREPGEGELEREMAAIWASSVDDFSYVPFFVAYELGASLVEALVARVGARAAFDLLSSGGGGSPGEFLEEFRELAGEDWGEFLGKWLAALRRVEVSPQGALLYEYRRRCIRLRESFLWPLLSEAEKEELSVLHRAFYAGEATGDDLERAAGILEGVEIRIHPEVLAALERRVGSLRHWVRLIAGPAAAREVSQLEALRIIGYSAEYVEGFVTLVNRYLIFQVPSP